MYDVIVIGSGFAGAVAARTCRQAGLSVLILEAKDRIGGRTWSSDWHGTLIELGGSYVYWSQPHIWAEITRYQLHLKERPNYAPTNAMQQTRFLMDDKVHTKFSKKETTEIADAFKAFVRMATEVFPEPFSPFLNEKYKAWDALSNLDRINALDLTPLQRATVIRMAAIQCNNDPSQGSFIEALRWYALANGDLDTYAHSLSRFSLKEGTAHLLNCILQDADAPVILNALVDKITQTNDGISIFSGKKEWKGKKCIVATSCNVWKNITFNPTLSALKMQLSQEEHSGKGAKIYVQIAGHFKENRWSAIDEPILSILPHVVGNDSSIVVAFTNPAIPMTFTQENIENWFKKLDPTVKVLDFKYHDWVADPHTQGTWGNFRPNQMSQYLEAAQLPEGNIYFAGSDIALGWRGFMDGAIESGTRVARQLITQLFQINKNL